MYGPVPNPDVAAIIAAVEAGVKEVVGALIVQFGSYGQANDVKYRSLDEMAEFYKSIDQ